MGTEKEGTEMNMWKIHESVTTEAFVKSRYLCTHSEKYKEPLVFLSHTVIDPGTVMIHLPDTSFTNTAQRRETITSL